MSPTARWPVILDEDTLNSVGDLAPVQVATPPLLGTSSSERPDGGRDRGRDRLGGGAAGRQAAPRPGAQSGGGPVAWRAKAAEKLASLTGAQVVAGYAPGTIFDRRASILVREPQLRRGE